MKKGKENKNLTQKEREWEWKNGRIEERIK